MVVDEIVAVDIQVGAAVAQEESRAVEQQQGHPAVCGSPRAARPGQFAARPGEFGDGFRLGEGGEQGRVGRHQNAHIHAGLMQRGGQRPGDFPEAAAFHPRRQFGGDEKRTFRAKPSCPFRRDASASRGGDRRGCDIRSCRSIPASVPGRTSCSPVSSCALVTETVAARLFRQVAAGGAAEQQLHHHVAGLQAVEIDGDLEAQAVAETDAPFRRVEAAQRDLRPGGTHARFPLRHGARAGIVVLRIAAPLAGRPARRSFDR
jgi:hypothetical protein